MKKLLVVLLLFGALGAFELFNFTVTEFALNDLLAGAPPFFGVAWPLILTVAFCAIDFAGVARLFGADDSAAAQTRDWYLMGAWFLASAMNALLWWWGITLAVMEKGLVGDGLRELVPLVVALFVWLVRVLIIGSFSMAGARLSSPREGLEP